MTNKNNSKTTKMTSEAAARIQYTDPGFKTRAQAAAKRNNKGD